MIFKNILFLLLINLFFCNTSLEFNLSNIENKYYNINDSIFSNDINSNAIYEIINDKIDNQDTLWLRTGAGLSFVDFSNFNFPEFKSINNENLPQGGSPSIIVKNDFIAISGATSIYQNSRYRPMGTGIAWSSDKGHNWDFINQSIDDIDTSYIFTSWGNQDSIRFKAITTTIYNVSYDIEVHNEYIYATSFAGGLRRFNYTNLNPEWELIPLPTDSQSNLLCNQIDIEEYEYDPVDPPIGNDNHKAFSIFVENDYIWVGTGDGINKGFINPETNCIDWIHYNEDDGMEDRWIIGIRSQEKLDFNRLWTISWNPTLNKAIPHTLNYTDNGGLSWSFTRFFETIGAIVYDLNFDNDNVYASTDKGLYYSDGNNLDLWVPFEVDDISQTKMTDVVYTSNINVIDNQQVLSAGTPDGLFYSFDDGFTWEMYRAWNRTQDSENDNKRLSAYPNPFYIDEGYGQVRIVYFNSSNDNGRLDIYDFSMNHIKTLKQPNNIGNESEFVWDGKDKFFDDVSNGVYLCRLTLGNKYYWTKLMVVHS